jgi:hypothetical protein
MNDSTSYCRKYLKSTLYNYVPPLLHNLYHTFLLDTIATESWNVELAESRKQLV